MLCSLHTLTKATHQSIAPSPQSNPASHQPVYVEAHPSLSSAEMLAKGPPSPPRTPTPEGLRFLCFGDVEQHGTFAGTRTRARMCVRTRAHGHPLNVLPTIPPNYHHFTQPQPPPDSKNSNEKAKTNNGAELCMHTAQRVGLRVSPTLTLLHSAPLKPLS